MMSYSDWSWLVLKTGKNGDRRHKDNKGVNKYRRKTDTKMPVEELTKRILGLERSIEKLISEFPKPGDVIKFEEIKREGRWWRVWRRG